MVASIALEGELLLGSALGTSTRELRRWYRAKCSAPLPDAHGRLLLVGWESFWFS